MYKLGQLNYGFVSRNEDDDQAYFTKIEDGKAVRLDPIVNEINNVEDNNQLQFKNEALQVRLEPGITYYFHVIIKHLQKAQQFSVFLSNGSNDNETQFIKDIIVPAGSELDILTEEKLFSDFGLTLDSEILKNYTQAKTFIDNFNGQLESENPPIKTDDRLSLTFISNRASIPTWSDFEFLFTPQKEFQYIEFDLQRITDDYTGRTRFPVIIYEELSKVNKLNKEPSWKKIGVQSHPGLVLSINGEEVIIGKSGIFELKDNTVPIISFAVIKAAEEDKNILEDVKKNLVKKAADYQKMTIEEQSKPENIISESRLNISKTRNMDAFMVDYLYNEDEESTVNLLSEEE